MTPPGAHRPKAAERLVWAVETLDVRPTDRLLEIGCGHGIAVSLVCEKLRGGSITAIDRSATMITVARGRNADHVAAGVASFQAAALHEARLPGGYFDTIFAVNVGVFWRQRPDRARCRCRQRPASTEIAAVLKVPWVAHQHAPQDTVRRRCELSDRFR